ncbi:hypothetical protein [Natrialba swarupiae]|uniref:Uncharacterized protein n=1 Tax=Natrialba swarupiae TaxID=2448032 RepID=A0A5D5AGV0_9EURY|nr:hypothetical protein [Natrialba swarupiae]TYT61059.1 hypothetical protein FYC77_15305 [Natrialba swarupiae]
MITQDVVVDECTRRYSAKVSFRRFLPENGGFESEWGFRQADTRNARTLDDLIGGIVTGPQSGMDVNEYVGPETGVARG